MRRCGRCTQPPGAAWWPLRLAAVSPSRTRCLPSRGQDHLHRGCWIFHHERLSCQLSLVFHSSSSSTAFTAYRQSRPDVSSCGSSPPPPPGSAARPAAPQRPPRGRPRSDGPCHHLHQRLRGCGQHHHPVHLSRPTHRPRLRLLYRHHLRRRILRQRPFLLDPPRRGLLRCRHHQQLATERAVGQQPIPLQRLVLRVPAAIPRHGRVRRRPLGGPIRRPRLWDDVDVAALPRPQLRSLHPSLRAVHQRLPHRLRRRADHHRLPAPPRCADRHRLRLSPLAPRLTRTGHRLHHLEHLPRLQHGVVVGHAHQRHAAAAAPRRQLPRPAGRARLRRPHPPPLPPAAGVGRAHVAAVRAVRSLTRPLLHLHHPV